jgi:uncharacterized protein (DUF924 family)
MGELNLGSALADYTNKRKVTYDPVFDALVRARFPHWFEAVALKKKAILDLPINSSRPDLKHPLGTALTSYIARTHSSYDADFEAQVRDRFPHWFEDAVARKKAEILAMPVDSPRPNQKTHPLGQALSTYLRRGRLTYDQSFDAQVRVRFPHWFEDTAAQRKKSILELPANAPKPQQGKHPLGVALSSYIGQSHATYDPAFEAQVRAQFPHWFIDTAVENKKQLLAMPAGAPRPVDTKHPLGRPLQRYTNIKASSYDADFDAQVRSRFPHWFEDTVAKKKKELLELPIDTSRPQPGKHPLANALNSYIGLTHDCYDSVFHQAIQKRFPKWFVNTADIKKTELLTMPINSSKPKGGSNKLAVALSNYTRPNTTSYDPEFDAAIRAKFPHWFKNSK